MKKGSPVVLYCVRHALASPIRLDQPFPGGDCSTALFGIAYEVFEAGVIVPVI